MISETQQEQAALYALGLLDADEAEAFERQIDVEAEVREFVHGMEGTIAQLAWAGDRAGQKPPPELKARILAQVKARHGSSAWLPWAIAALLLGCSGVLLWAYARQSFREDDLRVGISNYQHLLDGAAAEAARSASIDPLTQMSFCALEPTPDFKTGQPRAMVLWDAAHHQGKLRVNRLAPPAEGKDYQLWTVEKDRKDPVNAGVFHVNPDGTADVPFQPVNGDCQPVAAVAISLEQAGGSPTNQGPILLLGKF